MLSSQYDLGNSERAKFGGLWVIIVGIIIGAYLATAV
jgi:hypothetical protein